MKKYLIFFFLLISIELIKPADIIYDTKTSTLNLNNSNITQDEMLQQYLKMIENIKLTDEERDKLVFCGTISQMKVNNDEKIINDILNKVKGISKEQVIDKFGTVLIKKCMNNINVIEARKNLEDGNIFANIDFNKEGYKYFGEFDYYDYKTEKDLEKTKEEVELTYKFHKAINIINKKNEELTKGRDTNKNFYRKKGRNLEAFGLELTSIPTYVKVIIFIVVLVIIFGGILYYINKIINKPKKEKKDKKKKKKTQ